MAKTIWKPFVGQRIYAPYAPQRAGIITHVGPTVTVERPDKTLYVCEGNFVVIVRWLTGEEQEQHSMHLNDFDALITETTKKLMTHTSTLDRLKTLQGAIDAEPKIS